MSGDTETTIARMRDAASAMQSVTTSTGDEIRALAAARNAIDAALCDRLAQMDASKAHETDGASSIGTWARRELHQDAGLTRQMVRAARTCRDLPLVGQAVEAGEVGFEHVNSFTYALKHVGVEERQVPHAGAHWPAHHHRYLFDRVCVQDRPRITTSPRGVMMEA